MALHSQVSSAEDTLDLNPMYTLAGHAQVPKHRIPDGELNPISAYRVVHDELMLDGNARLNTATFVSTWMEDQARLLMAEAVDKNMIDKDEYPQTAELERRCVNMLADLWHAQDREEAMGCSTVGSSEAAMLAGLALKWRWRERMRKVGKPTDKPNMVTGANVQISGRSSPAIGTSSCASCRWRPTAAT